MKQVILLLLLLGVVLGQEGCSLSLDGKSRLSLDVFVRGFADPAVQFSEGSFDAWIKPSKHNDADKDYGVIMQTGIINDLYSYSLSYDYKTNLMRIDTYVMVYQQWAQSTWLSAVKVHPDVWTHIFFPFKVEHEANNNKLWINGQEVNTTLFVGESTTERNVHPSYSFVIGAYFKGNIDEVHLWRSTFGDNVAHIQKLAKEKYCGSLYMWLLALYLPFDECTGNVTADISANQACGKIKPAESKWEVVKQAIENKKLSLDDNDKGKFKWWPGQTQSVHPSHYRLAKFEADAPDVAAGQREKRSKHHGDHNDDKDKEGHKEGHSWGKWSKHHDKTGHDDDKKGHDEDKKGHKEGHSWGKWSKHHDGKWGGEGKHGKGHRCGEMVAIVYGEPSPAAPSSACENATARVVSDIAAQCPYATWRQTAMDSSSSDSEEFPAEGDSAVMSFLWMLGIFLFLVSCFACCRRMAMKARVPPLAPTVYQPVPIEEHNDYPSAPHPYFAMTVDSENGRQPSYAMPPPEMMMVGGDPNNINAPYMYYMPQPMFYAPNMERTDEQQK